MNNAAQHIISRREYVQSKYAEMRSEYEDIESRIESVYDQLDGALDPNQPTPEQENARIALLQMEANILRIVCECIRISVITDQRWLDEIQSNSNPARSAAAAMTGSIQAALQIISDADLFRDCPLHPNSTIASDCREYDPAETARTRFFQILLSA